MNQVVNGRAKCMASFRGSLIFRINVLQKLQKIVFLNIKLFL